MSWPHSSRDQAWGRLLAARPPPWVMDHCRHVEALALAMARQARRHGMDPDLQTISSGALLHDIGRSRTQDPTHGHVGATMLEADGPDAWPAAVVTCVRCHTGAGLEAEEAAALGLPPGDYVPRSLEARIVCHADNLYSGSKRLPLEQVLAKYAAKGLEDAGARIARLHAELGRALGLDLDALQPASLPDPANDGGGGQRGA